MDTLPMVLDGLTVTRGERDFGPIDLTLEPGDLAAIVGPNGCGKTTILQAALGLIARSAGTSRVFGHEPRPHSPAQSVGFLPDRPIFWDWMSAHANLAPFAVDEGDIPGALARVGLDATGRRPVARFSRGMQQRLGLARVMVARPRLLVLDEPTIALDRAGVQILLDLLADARQTRMGVLMSCHDHEFIANSGARTVEMPLQ